MAIFGRRGQAGQEGRDGLGGSQEKDQRKDSKDGPDLRQGERVQSDPDGGEFDGHQVEDVMRQIQKDEDAYVTMQGEVLKTSEKLRSCGVTDGCTIQVTSRISTEKSRAR